MPSSPPPDGNVPLAAEFPPATREQWLKLVDGVLKGGSLEKLVSTTADGLRIEPLPDAVPKAIPIAGRKPGTPWQIMQRVDHPDAATANAQALNDLENGATGLSLVFAGSLTARGFGLDPSPAAIARTLQDVHLDAGISIELEIGPQSREAIQHIGALLAQRGIAASSVELRCGIDPISSCALWGYSPYAWNDIGGAVADAVNGLSAAGFRGPFVALDGRVVSDAGGSEAQELAYVLACGVAYLRALEAGGVSLADARDAVYARLSADADQFLTLSKFRALRKLWARIEQACGLQPKPLFIAAETAWRMLTQRDTGVNMLRATTATFSAGVGGADSLSVLPHSLALGLPDDFARRVARNTQLVLLEESHLAKVADPAAGTGIIEQTTAQLCEAAWSLFQDIERAGGIFAALKKNILQDKVAEAAAKRAKRIAERRDALTGSTEFPDLAEAATSVLDAKPVTLPAYGDGKPHATFKPLRPHRLAEPFEALRDKSDAILKKSGKRPRIFLANLGTPADFIPRAQFAKSFFEAGGIEAIEFNPSSPLPSGKRSAAQQPGEGEQLPEVTALVAAFKASDATAVCLCSTDRIYAEQAESAASALAKAGARPIYLAGRPGDAKQRYESAGIGEFIFAGCDALQVLNAAYDRVRS
jgi:methylmalonyl-CoA mutase